MITEETISRVREANDIVEVIGERVALKRAGKDFKGLCPFHQEKTPSFMVSPSKGIFHCFGCAFGGDVFKFVMEMERLSYPEAIERLAERRGIAIVRDRSAPPDQDRHYERKKLLFQILDRAAQFYFKTLLDSKEAAPARDYIRQKRKLADATVEKFRIGWAPQGPDALYRTALKAGFKDADLLEAGVLVKSQRDGRILDVFRGRIVFPILDLKGQVIGFGGRILDGAKGWGGNPPPKYLNSADSGIFQKGKNLYGFYHASKAIREKDEALLLEGYMDVIACHQAGVENAVAPLGTSLTQEQCQILKRYAGSVTVLFDMDKAGEAAGIRGAELLLESGFFPMMARLPEGKDADEYLKGHSREDFESVLKAKVNLSDFRVETLLKEKADLPLPVRRAAAAKGALSLVLKARDEIVRSELLKSIAMKAQVSLESVLSEWRKLSKPKGAASPENAKGRTLKSFLSSEEEFLCLAALHPPLRARLASVKEEFDLFRSAAFEECCRLLISKDAGSGILQVLGALSEASASELRAMLLRFEKTKIENPSEIFESIAARLHRIKEEERLKSLGPSAARNLNEGRAEARDVQEFRKLAPALKGRKEE